MSETFEELGRRADKARQYADAASHYLRVHSEKIEAGLTASINFPGSPHSALEAAFLKRVGEEAVKQIDLLGVARQVADALAASAEVAVAEMRNEFDRVAANVGVAAMDAGNRTGGPIPSADVEKPVALPPTDGLPPAEPGGPERLPAVPYRNGNSRRKSTNGNR